MIELVLGDSGDSGGYGNSAYVRKHNAILARRLEDAVQLDDRDRRTRHRNNMQRAKHAHNRSTTRVKMEPKGSAGQETYDNPLSSDLDTGSPALVDWSRAAFEDEGDR